MAILRARFYGSTSSDAQGHRVPAGKEPAIGKDEITVPDSMLAPKGTTLVRLISDADIFVEWNEQPAPGAILLVAGVAEYFGCSPDDVIYAALTAGGQ